MGILQPTGAACIAVGADRERIDLDFFLTIGHTHLVLRCFF
jgi:hypothetical protein